jgi:hypothetical protein
MAASYKDDAKLWQITDFGRIFSDNYGIVTLC